MGMACIVVLSCAGRLSGGESGVLDCGYDDSRFVRPDVRGAVLPAHDMPEGMVSIRKNAVVSIGGEIRVDYSYRNARATPKGDNAANPSKAKLADLSVRNANLRIAADVHPNVRAFFKLNLQGDAGHFRDREEMLEEALLVMGAIGGTGLELFAGKGRAPYGQDVTLGMLQSYHHTANRVDSPEGRVFIIDPPADHYPDPSGPDAGKALPPMRPGQFDRAFLAGAAYEWDDRWRVEAAMFQPNRDEYRPRLDDGFRRNDSVSDLGFAGRVWWSPVEDLSIELSGMAAHASEMGKKAGRYDLSPGAKATDNAYAVSLGFDWRPGPWRVFGEYQHAWDWNFSENYDVDIWQIGLGRELAANWRVGGMAEGMRIRGKDGGKTVDEFYKLALNIRYVFTSGVFVMAEYGHEWFRRESSGSLADKRRGDFFGMRVGLTF